MKQSTAGLKRPTLNSIEPTTLNEFLHDETLNGRTKDTTDRHRRMLKQLAKVCDITNPYEVKEVLAQTKWRNSTKQSAVNMFTAYYKFIGKEWKRPTYLQEERFPFIPTEQELDALIAASKNITATRLQLLKETGVRTCEAIKLKWENINPQTSTVSVAPSKGSNPRILPLSAKLIGMLQSMPKTTPYIYPQSKHTFRTTFERTRQKAASKLNSPRILQITLHTFRHWKGTMEYHKLRDLRAVQKILGHKSILSTQIYENTEQALFLADSDEWVCKVAHNEAEAIQLIEAGDGEGYLYVFLHSNPSYRRQIKKGYAREFRCFISSGSKDLLEKVQTNIGNIGTITRHKYKPETLKQEKYRGKHRVDNYTLRFYQGSLRRILPKVIPYLILKKDPAEIMLKMLEVAKKIRNQQLRERTLLLMQREFDEACFKSAGNKYRRKRKQNLIMDRMIGQDGKVKLDSFA